MQLFSAGIRKTFGCTQLKTVFFLLCLSIVLSPAVVAQVGATVSTVIKVCVKDDTGNEVDQPKIIVANAPKAVTVNFASRDREGCYSSGEHTLNLNSIYIVAALKDTKTAASVLKLTGEQNVTTVNLTLRENGTSQPRTNFTFCAQDENQQPVQIKDIALSGSNESINNSTGDNDGCAKVQFAAANAYQFNLRMANAAAAAGSSGVPVSLLLPVLATLLLTSGLCLIVWRMRGSLPVRPEGTVNGEVYEIVKPMSGNVAYIRNKVDELTRREHPSNDGANRLAQSDPDSSEAVEIDPADVTEEEAVDSPGMTLRRVSMVSLPAQDLTLRQIAEAKQKYSDFITGGQVNHISLMPLGNSSASRIVAEAQVKLREQDYGTYIAFCPDNGVDEAWVFPRPGLHYTPESFSAVFPILTEQDYQSGVIEPRKAVKSAEPKLWRIE